MRPFQRGWGTNELPSLCWHVTAINPPSRTPAGGLNLEYGVSAVFPCGVTPAPVQNGGTPHTSDYRSRKFVFRSVAHSQFLSNVDLCGVPGVWHVGPLRPHGRRRTRRTPSWFASSDARLRRQPGERVASAARWKRRQHNRGSNLMRVGDQCQATTHDPRGPLGISAGEWGRVGGDYHRQRTLAVWRARELILKIRGE
jgi:hypothetical protein